MSMPPQGWIPPQPPYPPRSSSRGWYIASAVMGVLLLFLVLYVFPRAMQWRSCGASPGASAYLAVAYGEPTFLQCLSVSR